MPDINITSPVGGLLQPSDTLSSFCIKQCKIQEYFMRHRHPLLQGEFLLQQDAERKAANRAAGGARRRRLSNRKLDADAASVSDSDDDDQVPFIPIALGRSWCKSHCKRQIAARGRWFKRLIARSR